MSQTIDHLSDRVHRARELRRERGLAAQRCGCGQRCGRCRASLTAATHLLVDALMALDDALEGVEQDRLRQLSAQSTAGDRRR